VDNTEFKQKMAEIYLSNAESLMNTGDELCKRIKPMAEEMSECYRTAKRLIEVAEKLINETH